MSQLSFFTPDQYVRGLCLTVHFQSQLKIGYLRVRDRALSVARGEGQPQYRNPDPAPKGTCASADAPRTARYVPAIPVRFECTSRLAA